MIPQTLHPQFELLREDYLLVQAWKKTATYIRYHNWFSDTLELDHAAVNLPDFLGEIRERLQSPKSWENHPLRIIPAPKSQQWTVHPNGTWEPRKKKTTGARLRPLAHVALSDQVVATAIMLCLADRVETLQGDPRRSIRYEHDRRAMVSYGNRLFCDSNDEELRHRWGSTKLYRAYYQDYRTFLARPDAATKILDANCNQIFLVHADLRQFYDRVRPNFLATAIRAIQQDSDDSEFFDFATSVLDWHWDPKDKNEVSSYSQQAGLDDFSRVALPQGLVASGFFANLVLLSFDAGLQKAIGTEIDPGIVLADACRYVDDLRLTVAVDFKSHNLVDCVTNTTSNWLDQLLKQETDGLELSKEKTRVVALSGYKRPIVRQSARMNRIQEAVSGGFDALGGEEILDAILGLIRAQETMSEEAESSWRLSPAPDVRDETVARFAAARFRTTFRSIRPLLEEESGVENEDLFVEGAPSIGRARVMRTRRQLDEDARAFALGLVQRWIKDPSNVRLLRVGLDIWPDVEVLTDVLNVLRPFTEKGGRRKAPRRVAWYCLSEVLKAGATETGFVTDGEFLPSDIDLQEYRKKLRDEAVRLVNLPSATIPWYLRQQALLFLAAFDPKGAPIMRSGTAANMRHYRNMIRFLRGESDNLTGVEFATYAVLARRAFVDRQRAFELARPYLNASRIRQIAQRDLLFLAELIETDEGLIDDLTPRVREDLAHGSGSSTIGTVTLAEIVIRAHPNGRLRNELSLLRFGKSFLIEWRRQESPPRVITPNQVLLKLTEHDTVAGVEQLRIVPSRVGPSGSLYQPPGWCSKAERWRFQLGYLFRFILSGHPDFTCPVRPQNPRESEPVYRPARSHWHQRMYSFFSGQSAFGDNWVPITDWMEQFLYSLLRWPGCRVSDRFEWVECGIEESITGMTHRIEELENLFGNATGTLLLPVVPKRPTATNDNRSLRACVVQTVIPDKGEFLVSDLELNDPAIRRRHRNHLSAALAAVERMLSLRETHKGAEGRLDWLILPELATHPSDVHTHLIPFARAHKTMILTGLTYERTSANQPLVNSALWIIPEWSDSYGLQIRIIRQGKEHLAPDEKEINKNGPHLRGFRPCQWLVGYPWSCEHDSQPLWLTAAVCYDATDLGLAADLRSVSDVFAIPALNKDVKTFDQMALALHYHMFQLVIVVNNGQFGGSNAYWPRSCAHKRQVFHMHGQPQGSIAFVEIDNITEYLERKNQAISGSNDWKYPPAGL